MADYKGIKGFKVQSLASDPSTDVEGQVWYNTTSNALKYTGPGVGAWATGGQMSTARRVCAAFGTQSATVAGGGGPPYTANTEEYDGSTWASGGAYPSSPALIHNQGGAGVLTAGLGFGGSNPIGVQVTTTAEYDGSTWTLGGAMTTARAAVGSFGTQTAAIGVCGQGYTAPIPTSTPNCESYNGVSWTDETGSPTEAQLGGACGTSTAGLYAGYSPKTPTQTQTWNGTAWTMVSPGAFTIDMYAVAVFGTQTSAIKSGGLPPGTNTTPNMQSADEWDGSTWTATTSKSVANASGNGTGTAALGLVFGGYDPLASPTSLPGDLNEEWTKPDFSAKTVTVS